MEMLLFPESGFFSNLALFFRAEFKDSSKSAQRHQIKGYNGFSKLQLDESKILDLNNKFYVDFWNGAK